MKMILTRAGLLIMLPLLPVALIIDILMGDMVTGFKTPAKDKVSEHWKLFKDRWFDKDGE